MTTDLDDWTPESVGIDADLYSPSCLGIGVKFPQLWEVIQRYILRGDDWFQYGGLSVLADTAFYLPLDQAANVVEQYFEKHGYFPTTEGRGGISLAALQAAYAIGTTPDYSQGDVDQNLANRRARMVAVLERCEEVVRTGVDMPDDASSVRETIEAILSNRGGFQARYPDPEVTDTAVVASSELWRAEGSTMVAVGISRDEAVRLVRSATESLEEKLTPVTLTEMDRIIIKKGHEMLQQQVDMTERRLDSRIDDLHKAVDRYLGERQVQTGEVQVRQTIRSNRIAAASAALALASIIISLLLAFA